MANDIGIIVADSSEDFRRLLAELIEAEGDMHVLGCTGDGRRAEELIYSMRPDVLILDLLLRELEGLELIRRLHERRLLPRTIVVSAFFNDRLASAAAELGVDAFFPKPCSTQGLLRRIRLCCSGEEGSGVQRSVGIGRALDRCISEVLLECGLLPHHKGYRFLRAAISMVLAEGYTVEGLSKILYPDLAKRVGCTAQNVERCIRSAVESAWRDEEGAMRRMLPGGRKPTNSSFISFMAELVRRRMEDEGLR